MNVLAQILTAIVGAGGVTVLWNYLKLQADTRHADELRLIDLNDRCLDRYLTTHQTWVNLGPETPDGQWIARRTEYLLHFLYIVNLSRQMEFASLRKKVRSYLERELRDWRFDMCEWILNKHNREFFGTVIGNFGVEMVTEFELAVKEHGDRLLPEVLASLSDLERWRGVKPTPAALAEVSHSLL